MVLGGELSGECHGSDSQAVDDNIIILSDTEDEDDAFLFISIESPPKKEEDENEDKDET